MKYIFLIAVLSCCSTGTYAQENLKFSIKLPELNDKKTLDNRYFSNQFGCTGNNIRPTIEWENPPNGTKSFAVTFYDKDAPTGSGFWQWVVIDIPKSIHFLASSYLPQKAKEQLNDAGSSEWLGPCPPVGTTHHYELKVYALDIENLPTKFGNSAPLTGYFIHMHSIESVSKVLEVSR